MLVIFGNSKVVHNKNSKKRARKCTQASEKEHSPVHEETTLTLLGYGALPASLRHREKYFSLDYHISCFYNLFFYLNHYKQKAS